MLNGWEEIACSAREQTERMRVPGGWLYRSVIYNSEDGIGGMALTFVPLSLEETASTSEANR